MIKLNDVRKSYITNELSTEVIKGISLEINDGEFCMIFGQSGSGKSTLLYLIGLLENVTSGQILVDGVDVSAWTQKQQSDFRLENIGFVFQSYNLVDGMTALDNVLLPVALGKKRVSRYVEQAKRYLEAMGLGEKCDKYPHELSGGEQQRIAIARAMILKPRIILADEPTGNLDEKTGLEVMNMLQQVNKQQKCTIIMVSHNKSMVEYADKVITIKDGLLKG